MFILRTLFGVRRRSNRGFSTIMVIGGIMGLCMACGVIGFLIPSSLYRAWEVGNLPQPRDAELEAVPTGTTILNRIKLPETTATLEHGLILFYEEIQIETETPRRSTSREFDNETSTTTRRTWKIVTPPPQSMDVSLLNGNTITLQFSSRPSFLNGQQIRESSQSNEASSPDKRITGYLPGQTVTVEGSWEGDNRMIAQTLYAGTPDDYLNYLRFRQPGMMLMMAFFCGGVGLVLIIFSVGLRAAGR